MDHGPSDHDQVTAENNKSASAQTRRLQVVSQDLGNTIIAGESVASHSPWCCVATPFRIQQVQILQKD